MQGLTLCAICLLAVAAGLAVYEALNAWAGVKAYAGMGEARTGGRRRIAASCP